MVASLAATRLAIGSAHQDADDGAQQIVHPEGRESLLQVDDAGGQALDHADGDLRLRHAHLLEGRRIELDQPRGAGRHRPHRARPPQQDAHLAEELSRGEAGDQTRTVGAGAHQLDHPGLDDVEDLSLVPLVEDRLTRLEASLEGASDAKLGVFVRPDCGRLGALFHGSGFDRSGCGL